MAEKKAKILIVDDDPDILVAIGAVLEARNYEIVTARLPCFVRNDGRQSCVRELDGFATGGGTHI